MPETKNGPLEFRQDSFEEKHLQEYLDRVANILEITNPKYCIRSGSKPGDNYVGILYRISIEGEKNDVPIKVKTVFKVPPKDETMRLVAQIPFFFPREDYLYSEIVPIFEDFLLAKNKKLESIPKCYFSSAVDHKEAVCLEDLQPKGFLMRDRMKQMDFPHISLALRALGRFHALSFALRDQRPEIFASKIASMAEPLFRPEMMEFPIFVTRFEQLGNIIKTALADEEPRYKERLSTYLKDSLSDMEWSSKGKNAEPYAVLCHGDFWMNNMLFKYNEEDSSEPRDIYFLDFQVSRYASPVIDISYILFCNCSQELRNNHFDELIKIYHDSLSDYLSELGSDPKKLFPYEALWEQMEKFSVNAAGMAVLLLNLFTKKVGDDEQTTDGLDGEIPQLEKRIHEDHFWRNTAIDTFKDLIDRNYI